MQLYKRFYQILFVITLCFVTCNTGYGQSSTGHPRDLQLFLKNANTCRDYLKEKEKIISVKRLKKNENQPPTYCKTIKQEQKRLQRKYKYNKFMLKLISPYKF